MVPLLISLSISIGGARLFASEPISLLEIPRDNLPEEARLQLDELELEVETAAQASPADPVGLAAAYGELGNFCFVYDFLDAAEIGWANASVLRPEQFRWHYLLGGLLWLQGDFDGAVWRLERALSLRPNDVPSLVRLARIRTDQGDNEEARKLFERVLEIRPTTSAAQYGLGRIAILEGRFEDALVNLRAALPGQPEGSTVHHQLGLAYRGLGDLDNARLHLGLNRGARVGFSDPLVEGLVGRIGGSRAKARAGLKAQRSGRLDTAVRMLSEAVRLDPEDAWIRYNLGVVYEESGDNTAAEREFAEAVRLDPEYRNAQYNLARLLAEREDLEGAVRHFGRAREIDPEDHLSWLELSVALSRLGDSERALAELQALVEAAPALVEAKLNLSTLLAQVGRSDEALRWVDEILAGDATNEELASALLLEGRIVEPRDRAAAVRHYAQAVELDPASSEARSNLAMGLGRLGRFAEAADEFERAVALRPEDADLRMGQTMALLLGQSYGAALAALESATARLPQDLALSHTLARLLATSPDGVVRDGNRALELSRRLLEQRQTLDYAETVGMALAEVGRFDEAVEWQRGVLEQSRRQGSSAQSVTLSERYLSLYEQRRPVRAPWLGGG